MARAILRQFTPDLPPSGRVIRSRTMDAGNPKARRITTVRLGARPDRRDFNPDRASTPKDPRCVREGK